MNNLILLLNFASTWAMVGLIWLIQVVHYPLFSQVGSAEFTKYAHDHQRLITYIVLPLMVTELATSFGLWSSRAQYGLELPVAAGIVLVLVIWLSTFFLQVPQHGTLAAGWDAAVHQQLVSGNWIRTIAWSARGLLTGWMVWRVLSQ